jgi:hypothetical protein
MSGLSVSSSSGKAVTALRVGRHWRRGCGFIKDVGLHDEYGVGRCARQMMER